MKTHILQLDPHDDFISIRDQMAWSQGGRILLVWPLRGVLLRDKMHLALLRRRGQELGARVGLVTRDPVVRALAGEIGLPVFFSTRRAQELDWPAVEPGRPPGPPALRLVSGEALRLQQAGFRLKPRGWGSHPAVRLFLFTLAVLSVLALALFFYPSAEVRFTLAESRQQAEFPVWASPAVASPGPSGGIPARAVTVAVTGEGQIHTSGSAQVATRFAAGTARFFNLTDQEIEIPDGTVVRTVGDTPARFVTTAAVHLAAGPDVAADAPIRALQPGLSGNVEQEAIQALEGEMGLRLRVTNPLPLTGGEQVLTRAPTAADAERLREQLLAELAGKAAQQLALDLGTNGRPIPSTTTMIQVTHETQDPAVGQPGDVLTMTLTAEYAVWVIAEADLHYAAQIGLDASLPTGYEAVAGTLQAQMQGDVQYVEGRLARWQLRAERALRGGWSPVVVTGWLAGRSPEEARRILQSRLALAGEPVIQVTPSWWKRMPFLPARIRVNAP